MKSLLTLFVTFTLFTPLSFALVDYSSNSSVKAPKNFAMKKPNRRARRARAVPVQSRGSLFSMLTFNTGYTSVDGNLNNDNEKMDLYDLGMRVKTPWSMYFDMNFTAASLNSESTEESSGMEFGNSELMFGFNWLEVGGQFDRMIVDLVAGARFGVEESKFASERNDKYIGVITQKKFVSMDLSLGMEYWFLDDSVANETSVGGLQKYIASLGWSATSDIRFGLTTTFYRLSEVGNVGESITISEFSPQLILGLSNYLHLILGGKFSSGLDQNKSEVGDLRMWNVPSIYGNSLFANFSFTI